MEENYSSRFAWAMTQTQGAFLEDSLPREMKSPEISCTWGPLCPEPESAQTLRILCLTVAQADTQTVVLSALTKVEQCEPHTPQDLPLL